MGTKVGKFELDVKDKADPPVVSMAGAPISAQVYFVSHTWSDRTTWWQHAIKVTDEVCTRDGTDGRIYHSAADTPWIDASHGKIYQEGRPEFDDYRVVVTVDGVARTENSIDSAAWPGGDAEFEVDYESADIKFETDPGSKAEVKATYYKLDPTKTTAEQSLFVVKPAPGKRIRIQKVEVQFERGITITDDIVSSPYAPDGQGGFVEVVSEQTVYRTFDDYLAEAQGNYPIIPGGFIAGPRGISNDVVQIPWNWVGSKLLSASTGVEIRTRLAKGAVFTPPAGSARALCNVTFYCQEWDDV